MTMQQEERAGETMWERAQRTAAEMRAAEQPRSYVRAPYGVAAETQESWERRMAEEAKRAEQEARREEAAREAAEEYAAEVARTARDEAVKQIWIGGLICIVGLVVTAVSYSIAAEGGGGGKYVIAWGAVIFGAIRLIRGIVGWARITEPKRAE